MKSLRRMRPLHAVLVLSIAFPALESARASEVDARHNALARLGDVDADGVADLLVASRDRLPERVWIVSGKNGRVIHELAGSCGSGFGSTVGSAGDVDEDGIDDVFVGSTGFHITGKPGEFRREWTAAARIDVVSGRTGRPLWNRSAGSQACSVGDLDGDRRAELAFVEETPWVEASGKPECVERPLRLVVIAGKDGALVREISLVEQRSNAIDAVAPRSFAMDGAIPTGLALVDDVDGDGARDLAIGLPSARGVALVSPRTGTCLRLLEFVPRRGDASVGAALASGDVDGDGRRELAVGVLHDRVVVLAGSALASTTPLAGARTRTGHTITSLDAFAASVSIAAGTSAHPGRIFASANESGMPSMWDEGYVEEISWGDSNDPSRQLASSRTDGFDVCAVGDLDGDGKDDVVFSAQRVADVPPSESTQRIRAIAGDARATLWEIDVATLRERAVAPSSK